MPERPEARNPEVEPAGFEARRLPLVGEGGPGPAGLNLRR